MSLRCIIENMLKLRLFFAVVVHDSGCKCAFDVIFLGKGYAGQSFRLASPWANDWEAEDF